MKNKGAYSNDTTHMAYTHIFWTWLSMIQ